MLRLSDRPMPTPSLNVSSCTNSSKISSAFSFGTPLPLSSMLMASTLPSVRHDMLMLPPSGVNFMALSSRWQMACEAYFSEVTMVSPSPSVLLKLNWCLLSSATPLPAMAVWQSCSALMVSVRSIRLLLLDSESASSRLMSEVMRLVFCWMLTLAS